MTWQTASNRPTIRLVDLLDWYELLAELWAEARFAMPEASDDEIEENIRIDHDWESYLI